MKRLTLIASALALLLFGGLQIADANKTHQAALTGAGGGDPDGSGSSLVGLSPGGGEICAIINVSGIESATTAHLHKGAAGSDGPIVATLTPPSDGSSVGCVAIDPAVLKDLLKNPDDYYVDVHNAEYPNGALRGQLSH